LAAFLPIKRLAAFLPIKLLAAFLPIKLLAAFLRRADDRHSSLISSTGS
jgi:hypothetical protein